VDLGLFETNKIMVVFQPFLAMPEVANKELVVSLLSVVDVSLEIRKTTDVGCLWLLDNGGLQERKKMRE
jgi:hypothetical protein